MNDEICDELKPCPFCGCDDVWPVQVEDEPYGAGEWYVSCPCCDTRGPLKYTEENAIEAWNRRAEEEKE